MGREGVALGCAMLGTDEADTEKEEFPGGQVG